MKRESYSKKRKRGIFENYPHNNTLPFIDDELLIKRRKENPGVNNEEFMYASILMSLQRGRQTNQPTQNKQFKNDRHRVENAIPESLMRMPPNYMSNQKHIPELEVIYPPSVFENSRYKQLRKDRYNYILNEALRVPSIKNRIKKLFATQQTSNKLEISLTTEETNEVYINAPRKRSLNLRSFLSKHLYGKKVKEGDEHPFQLRCQLKEYNTQIELAIKFKVHTNVADIKEDMLIKDTSDGNKKIVDISDLNWKTLRKKYSGIHFKFVAKVLMHLIKKHDIPFPLPKFNLDEMIDSFKILINEGKIPRVDKRIRQARDYPNFYVRTIKDNKEIDKVDPTIFLSKGKGGRWNFKISFPGGYQKDISTSFSYKEMSTKIRNKLRSGKRLTKPEAKEFLDNCPSILKHISHNYYLIKSIDKRDPGLNATLPFICSFLANTATTNVPAPRVRWKDGLESLLKEVITNPNSLPKKLDSNSFALLFTTTQGFTKPLGPMIVFALIKYCQEKKLFNKDEDIKWFDPFAGWGDRLLAAIAHKNIKHYIATDPSTDMHSTIPQNILAKIAEYCKRKNIHKNINKTSQLSIYESIKRLYFFVAKQIRGDKFTKNIDNFQVTRQQIEKFDISKYHDFNLVFTSPPYWRTEFYSGQDNRKQSHHYETIDEWNKKFLKVAIEKSLKILKTGGILALKIATALGWRAGTGKDKPRFPLFRVIKDHLKGKAKFITCLRSNKHGGLTGDGIYIWKKTSAENSNIITNIATTQQNNSQPPKIHNYENFYNSYSPLFFSGEWGNTCDNNNEEEEEEYSEEDLDGNFFTL